MRTSPLLYGCFSALLAFASLAPTQEVRGVWVARDGLTSRTKIVSTLDQLAAANFNLVCVNVWSRGFTIHPSDVLHAACGFRQDPTLVGRDPLQEFVIEAHRRGMEVEAWFEYGFIGGWSGWYPGTNGTGPVLGANPSWIAMDVNGQTATPAPGGSWYWMAHENPAVREFLLDLAVELVDRYDVDGVQFDRIRYPSTDFGYDPATVALYRSEHGGASPPTNPDNSAWKRWRADKLSLFAGELHARVKARRPTVRVTNAPIVMNTAYDSFLQDWPAWLRAGWLDLVYPQVYRYDIASYVASLDQNLALFTTAQRQKIAPGIRAISGTPTSEVLGMVGANRTRNLPGQVFWYAEGIYDDLPALASGYFQSPAPLPGRPPSWRPTPIEREDTDPTTVATPAWSTATATNASGGTLLLSPPSAPAGEAVTFQLSPTEPGLWSVLAHQASSSQRSTAAPHEIAHAGGESLSYLNQVSAVQSGWRELGTFWLDPALGPFTLRVTAAAGYEVAADAAALMRSRFDSGAMVAYGVGAAGAQGVPTLGIGGRAVPGGALVLQVGRVPLLAGGVLAVGAQRQSIPVFGGALLTQPLVTTVFTAGFDGRIQMELPLAFEPALRGAVAQFQAFVLDSAAVGAVSITRAVEVTLQ